MRTIRDTLWLWGTRVNALQSYGFRPSSITIGEGLRTLEIDQAMMCGSLPPVESEYRPVSHCRRLLWEMSFDEGFSFGRPLAPIVALHRAHPNVVGVLLDDFSTTEISRGAQPELLEALKGEMPESLQLWVVIYSMSLGIPKISEYLRHVDGISFWVWRARDLSELEESVALCNELSGHKEMILGLYFYDFGDNRPMSIGQMETQVESGVRLLRRGECSGLCFLSSSVMDVGLETVEWTRRWIAEHGSEPV